MTFVKTVTIKGCNHERSAIWTVVDLDEPKKIGQHPNHETQKCSATPLKKRVELEVEVTGEIINDGKHPKHAEVIITCNARNCLHHELYKATS